MIDLLRRFRLRWYALSHAEQLDARARDEMRAHLEMEAVDLMTREQLTPSAAHRAARVRFGNASEMQEAHRDARGVRPIEDLLRDIRHAVRSLRRAPSFAVPSLLLLALGIGATTAMFSAIDAVVLSRLPYPHDEQLVVLNEQNSPTNRWTISVADYRGVQAWSHAFSDVAVMQAGRMAVITPGADAERMLVASVTASMLPTLGLHVQRGRGFSDADEVVGAPPVVILTQQFARSRFGSDANALGKTFTIDGAAATVIGILPPGITDLVGVRTDIVRASQLRSPTRRGPFGLLGVARLRPGMTMEGARQDLANVSARLLQTWTADFHDAAARIVVTPLRTRILGTAPQLLTVLSIAVLLVLLIAVSNVASLMLARGVSRVREVTLRATLGASRGRLARWLVSESLVLAVGGAILGVGVGAALLRVLIANGPRVPRMAAAHLSLGAVLFAFALAIVLGIAVGLYPLAMLLHSTDTSARDGSRTVGSRGAHRARGWLVIGEFALALPLLACAGLLLNTFLALRAANPGFDPQRLYTVRVSLPQRAYPDSAAITSYWRRVVASVKAIPGVEDAGVSTGLPPNDPTLGSNNFNLVDHPVGEGNPEPTSPWISSTAEYFTALGLRLLDGRTFVSGDTSGAPPVAVVSQSWAKHYFPEGKVVGRQLVEGGCYECPHTTVVGIVSDVRYNGVDASADAVYVPFAANWTSDAVLFVRSRSPDAVATAVRAALHDVDPAVPLQDSAPMEARMGTSLSQQRALAEIVSGFAGVAVLLAAIGIFGTMSYTVNLRRREIGVRMALGAARPGVVMLFVRNGLTYALIGAVGGLVLAALATHRMASGLGGLHGSPPVQLVGAAVMLVCVAMVASWLPARRAAEVNPLEAIRGE